MVRKQDPKKVKFIEFIREAPFLYNKADKDYNNRDKVEKEWKVLAKDHGYSGTLCL